MLFAGDRERPVEVPGSRKAELVRWLSKRIGVTVPVPDLSEFGYRLLGGRLVANDAKPAAQLMYAGADGRRITLFVTREDTVRRPVAETFDGEKLHTVCLPGGPAAHARHGAADPPP